MKASVTWKENMVFAGETNSGSPVLLDADAAVGGANNGPRPMEMIALGLAGCTAMDVISILKKKRQEVTHFDVRLDAPRSHDHPKVFTSAVITYVFSGKDIDESAVLRAIELSTTKYCPAIAMLEQSFPIDHQYEIYEDEGNGQQRLTHQGSWQEVIAE